ncbi:hypothetical protein ASPACDRAFT_48365 [Aspergillus aculeatus ATCC 16872]|uniref:Uncharacterized protein n=1 Tax=Aspergillus aculeatus (strain ATCC 16872 / CBS 172.66 / WB 5094) TaxID=690307 RepID=A0A1L9WFF7_ASPA1|nr:uncharacterized protein ASPACDRAFT_48365 [Aspergillus aculeatus ATCC 16872]OJJ94916.1 hypothetical protein ASPACDRAFT_48365 [Aspergillus aculeatus ATCC 16872]
MLRFSGLSSRHGSSHIVHSSELAAGLINTRKPEEEPFQEQRFIPARRFGGDEEMAGAILYLARRAGSYSNGSNLVADVERSSVVQATYQTCAVQMSWGYGGLGL